MVDCRGNVAVVGNGGLSEEDRVNIERHDCVIRFNDLKNFRPNEKFDVHATRYSEGIFTGMHKNTGQPVLPVCTMQKYVDQADELKHKNVLPTLLIYESQFENNNELSNNKKLFINSQCDDKCKQSNTAWGPSTGTAVIDMLENSEEITSISTFGMNWNGNTSHVDFKHPSMVNAHCTKCNIHHTPADNY